MLRVETFQSCKYSNACPLFDRTLWNLSIAFSVTYDVLSKPLGFPRNSAAREIFLAEAWRKSLEKKKILREEVENTGVTVVFVERRVSFTPGFVNELPVPSRRSSRILYSSIFDEYRSVAAAVERLRRILEQANDSPTRRISSQRRVNERIIGQLFRQLSKSRNGRFCRLRSVFARVRRFERARYNFSLVIRVLITRRVHSGVSINCTRDIVRYSFLCTTA